MSPLNLSKDDALRAPNLMSPLDQYSPAKQSKVDKARNLRTLEDQTRNTSGLPQIRLSMLSNEKVSHSRESSQSPDSLKSYSISDGSPRAGFMNEELLEPPN